MTLFPEAEVSPLPEPVPPRPDYFIVLAVWAGSWSLPSNLRGRLFTTRDSAEHAARTQATGWKHIRIVRIPGETRGPQA